MERTGESVGGESVGNALPPRWYMSLVGLFLFCPLWGTVERMELEPAMDSTLFSEDSSAANGAGEVLFVGRIKRGPSYRRVLLGFDLEGIPSNSLIENVTLRITTRHNPWSSEAFVLHRLTRAWGEGLSDSAVSPIGPSIGKGAPAEESDATWSHALFGGTMWSIPGGDYVAENSAVATMEGTGSTAEWSSAQMVADVRDWLENPRSNFGWILKGPEGGTTTVRW